MQFFVAISISGSELFCRACCIYCLEPWRFSRFLCNLVGELWKNWQGSHGSWLQFIVFV